MKPIFMLCVLPLLISCEQEQPKPPIPFEGIASTPTMNFIYITDEYSDDEENLYKLSKHLCRNKKNVCVNMYWDQKEIVPFGLPMTDEQVNAKVAHYNYNKNTGMDRLSMCNNGNCN